MVVEPDVVLRSRLARGKHELLVHWKGAPAAETAWVELDDFRQQFLDFQLEDELRLQGGRDVMWGCTYGRRMASQGGVQMQD